MTVDRQLDIETAVGKPDRPDVPAPAPTQTVPQDVLDRINEGTLLPGPELSRITAPFAGRGVLTDTRSDVFDLDYRSSFGIWSGELEHIATLANGQPQVTQALASAAAREKKRCNMKTPLSNFLKMRAHGASLSTTNLTGRLRHIVAQPHRGAGNPRL